MAAKNYIWMQKTTNIFSQQFTRAFMVTIKTKQIDVIMTICSFGKSPFLKMGQKSL
jgi:hypothetical protein